MSTDAYTKPCPFCRAPILFEASTHTVGHEYPECMGYKATLARVAPIDVTTLQIRDLRTNAHLGNVRIAHG
jgi:hypothetical protein